MRMASHRKHWGFLGHEVAVAGVQLGIPGRVQSGVDPMAATRPTRWSIPASAMEMLAPIEKPPATTLLVDTSWWAVIQSRTQGALADHRPHVASSVL